MIDKIKSLTSKINALESKIDKIALKANSTKINTAKIINKKFLNLSILNSSMFKIAEFTSTNNNSLSLICKVKFYLPSSQNVEISLIVNNISIEKTTGKFTTGENEVTLVQNYQPLTNSNNIINVSISSLDKKQIELTSINLNIYGLDSDNFSTSYNFIKTQDSVWIMVLNNEELFLLNSPIENQYFNSSDFTYHSASKSASFAKINETVYLFRVDTDENLKYSILPNSKETLLQTNISHVSASGNDSIILLVFIKNNKAFYMTFENNTTSNPKSLFPTKSFTSTFTYYNNYNNKFYVILSDKNNSNYLVESKNEELEIGENLSTKILFNIETYEVQNETNSS